MEKITYAPLIKLLQESEDKYNQIYREHELRYGTIDKSLILPWMVSTIEPIIIANAGKEESSSKLFQALYTELLSLLGNRLGIVHEQEYQTAWLLCICNPALVQTSPARMIKAIDGALLSLRTYQPSKVMMWINVMNRLVAKCLTIDEFLSCGRVVAWMCGMAHLRTKALESFQLLSSDLKEALSRDQDLTFNAKIWTSENPAFRGETGGFAGLDGVFLFPPRVALIDNVLFATDTKSSCALFADQYGKVLLSDITVEADDIFIQSDNKALKTFHQKFGKDLVPFDDITSCALTDSTFVLTRSSSFHLFIYGWSN